MYMFLTNVIRSCMSEDISREVSISRVKIANIHGAIRVKYVVRVRSPPTKVSQEEPLHSTRRLERSRHVRDASQGQRGEVTTAGKPVGKRAAEGNRSAF